MDRKSRMQRTEGLWHSGDIRTCKKKLFSACVLLNNRIVPSGKGRNKGPCFVTTSNEKRIMVRSKSVYSGSGFVQFSHLYVPGTQYPGTEVESVAEDPMEYTNNFFYVLFIIFHIYFFLYIVYIYISLVPFFLN